MVDPTLASALQRWEEGQAAGQDLTPAELLPDCPELHGRLREVIRRRASDIHRPVRRSGRYPFQLTLIWLAIFVAPWLLFLALPSHPPAAPPPARQPNQEWDCEIGGGRRAEREKPGPIGVLGVAFRPDGKVFVGVGRGGYIGVWDAALDREFERRDWEGKWPWGRPTVRAVAYSPDDRALACGSLNGTVRVWNAEGNVTSIMPLGLAIRGLAFTHAGQLLVTTAEGATLFDGDTDTVIRTFATPDEPTRCGDISADGKRVVTGAEDGVIRLWDTTTGEETSRLEGHTGVVRGVAFSPAGATVASAGEDAMAFLWDESTGWKARPIHGHTTAVSAVCFSAHGPEVASGDEDGIIRVTDRRTGQDIARFRVLGPVRGLCFSPDGKVLVSGGEGGLRQWSMPRPGGPP
jgi:WD40 repeat protein